MADDDEIDILGDFTFNSCFAQNSQGIPSCSDREDTVHPQWLLDSTAANWYDKRYKEGPLRKLSGTNSVNTRGEFRTIWSKSERECLIKEMKKYGRNVKKISQTLKSKTEAEIQALMEAEFGVYLENPSGEIVKDENQEDVPVVGQEEIVSNEVPPDDPVARVQTASPTVKLPSKPQRGKKYKTKPISPKPDSVSHDKKAELLNINPSEILFEDDLVLGSTESIGGDIDSIDTVATNIIQAKEKAKIGRKLGNHRRKVSRNSDKSRNRNKSKDLLKSPQGRRRKNSSLSEDSTKSPKLQIVLGSGLALPLSEGEQVIKIEKMKDSDVESDIDVDVSSDVEESGQKVASKSKKSEANTSSAVSEEPAAVPLRKFEPMPKRQKKFNLDGDGGYTIMHTSAGDMYALGTEPRRERAPRKPTIHLLPCRYYGQDKPAPCRVFMHVSALLLMDAHAHGSSAEVMGLVGGASGGGRGDLEAPPTVTITRYRPADAAAGHTHCDMDPVSQAAAAAWLAAGGARALGWHHSHPRFPAAPSALDVCSQAALQAALDRPGAPFLAVITSQLWPRAARPASHYRCIRVEAEGGSAQPAAYELRARLVGDLTAGRLPAFLRELADVLLRARTRRDRYAVDLANDVCPHARLTYLEKFISSMSHHMRSAGYQDDDILVKQLIHYVRDVFR